MRVTHLITGLETGGAETMLHKLVSQWRGDALASAVVSLRDEGTLGAPLATAGAEVRTVGMRGPIPSPGDLLRLRREVAATRPDLLQAWMYHGNLAAIAARGAVVPRPPVIWNIRHSVYDLAYEKRFTAWVIRAGAWMSRRPERIIYNSATSAAQHAALGYDPSRAVVIPNGFDTDRFRPDLEARLRWRARLGIASDVPLVGLVARWHPMKDHGTFLLAAARLRSSVPGVRFVLAGRGVEESNPEFAALVRSCGLGAEVLGVGEIEDVPGFVATLDVATCSSFSEAFPNVLGEALSTGVPVVATDVGDSRTIVGRAGSVVPPSDPTRFAEAILELLRLSPEERKTMGAQGRERIVATYGLPAIADRYQALYSEVLARTKVTTRER